MKVTVIPNEQTPKVPEITDMAEFLSENKEKIQAFMTFAKTCHNAVGLAANQCAIDGERFMARLFALRDVNTKSWRLVINPVITKHVGLKEKKLEGCLTWKGRTIVAERSRSVIVSYLNGMGQDVENEIHSGFNAQIWQHEINHLNGVEEDVVDTTPPLSVEKINRNEPCPCGSGKKYKKCCLLLK